MKIDIVKADGQKSGKKADLNNAVFGIEPNDHVLYLAVKHHLANKRQGTHKTKIRSEISGSTKKIKKQKGTGTARFGDIKNPLFRGGGRVFGPEPRTYANKLNKKENILARKSALSYKAKDKHITVIEDFSFDDHKTKNFVNLLYALDLADNKVLLVLPETDNNVRISGRNIPNVRITTAGNLSTYDILRAQKLVIANGSLKIIEGMLAS